MFEELLKEIKGESEDGGLSLESEERAINKESFEQLPPAEELSACYVDGGNAPVFESPALRIEFIRVYGTRYTGKERQETKQEEGLLLIRNRVVGGKGCVEVKAFAPLSLEMTIPEAHPELSFGKERVTLDAAANLTRFLLECRFLKGFSKERDLLVRDGSLLGQNEYEREELRQLGEGPLAGLCKTHTLVNGAGGSASGSLLEQGPTGVWRSPYEEREGVAVDLVKLHERSQHIFRLDSRGGGARIAAALALVSGDAVFPGYPYPLIEADRMARVSNQELERLRMRLKAEAGGQWKGLERLSRGSDAHSILDRIS